MWCVGIPSGLISEMTAVLRRRFPDPNLADEDGPVPMRVVGKMMFMPSMT
jgi:hypothetical protein